MNNLKGNQPANSGIARHGKTVSLWRHVSGVSATRVTPGDWRKGGGWLGGATFLESCQVKNKQLLSSNLVDFFIFVKIFHMAELHK